MSNIVRTESRKSVPPDVISYFDPASVGGGGPLKRITTQQRERAEAEAREKGLGRIESIHEHDEEKDPIPEGEPEPEPEAEEPDGGYGWVVLACCVTLAAVSMG